MKQIQSNHKTTAILALALFSFMLPSLVQATTTTYSLSNHPGSGDSPLNPDPLQQFGLRLDGLLTGAANENYVLNFDSSSSNMLLTWDDSLNTIHIYGRSFGGQDASSGACASGACTDLNGDGMVDGTEAVWTIDFTYDTNFGTDPSGDDTAGFVDIHVGTNQDAGHANFGTMTSSLGTFELRDHYGLYDAAFIFGNDDLVSQNFNVLTGWGWVDYSADGITYGGVDNGYLQYPTAWFFKATVVPVPAAVWLFGSGLIGLVAVARRKKV